MNAGTEMAGLETAELRAVVREVVREVLRAELARSAQNVAHPPAQPPAPPAVIERTVSITSDAELAAFVGDLARLLGDPTTREELREGRLRFRLAGRPGPPPGLPPPHAAPPTPVPEEPRADPDVWRAERGAVTERQIAAAAERGHTVVLGPRAVLTPLAKEKARALRVQIERETPC